MSVSPIWIIPLTGLAATLFWEGTVLLPAKLLTVLVHEMGHAVVALLGGAHVERIVISLGESGETIVTKLRGLPAFAAAVSAGYLGSALVGGACLNRGILGRFERLTLLTFSLVLAYMSLLFTKGADPAFLTGIGWACALMVPVFLGRRASRATLLALGTLLLWYCFFDLFDFTGPASRTDADILADFLARQGFIKSASVPLASTIVALSWAIAIALCVFLLLRGPALGAHSGAHPGQAEADAATRSAEQEVFPGELTPEVELWLLQRGLAPDGQPLLADGIELPREVLGRQSAATPSVSLHGP